MVTTKRVTYTLNPQMIHFINHHSKWLGISKSKLVSQCIEECFPLMEEELEEKKKSNCDSLYENGKKFHNTYPITVTLPLTTVDKLNYFSKKLNVKKSHLVEIGIYLIEEKVNEELENGIKELMESSED